MKQKLYRFTRLALAFLLVGPIILAIRISRIVSRLFVRYVWMLLLCALGIGLLTFLLFVPQWEVHQTLGESALDIPKLQIENQIRTTWAQIFGGVFLLAGLIFAWLRIETSRRGQLTDRYIRAIDQLGSDNTVVRLGAIYGLERIANESSQEHWAVVDVLTAYVRHLSPWTDEREPQTPNPSSEITAILAVLARRNRSSETTGQSLLLARADLRGYRLYESHFERANLSYAHLENAVAGSDTFDFVPNTFEMKDGMLEINRRRFDLALGQQAAHFERCQMTNTRLDNFVGMGCRFEHATMIGMSASGAMLSWSHFERANLGSANFTSASLDNSHFDSAFMHNVVLKDAHLDSASFEKANLFDTDLRGVVFKNCKLTGANLNKADLRGADLSTAAGLKREQIDAARIDDTTKLPEYLGGIVVPH